MMRDNYDHLSQQVLDRSTQFLKEAEHYVLLKLAREVNSALGKEYPRATRLSLRQRLSVLFF